MYRSRLRPPDHTTIEGVGVIYAKPMPRYMVGTRSRDQVEYRAGDLYIICSIDDTDNGTILHVSYSRKSGIPTYTDTLKIREAFFPDDVDVMMVFPKSSQYVNFAKNCLHLWEMPMDWQPGKDGMI